LSPVGESRMYARTLLRLYLNEVIDRRLDLTGAEELSRHRAAEAGFFPVIRQLLTNILDTKLMLKPCLYRYKVAYMESNLN
jgi:hypothetical protein